MSLIRGVTNALGVDASEWWGPLGRATVRLIALAVLAALALAIMRRIVARIDDERLRQQLLFFLPKLLVVGAIVAGLVVVGVDVSGMAAVMATVGFTGAVVFTSVGQNLVAGAMIRIDDVYRVGETVTIGDLHGIVVYRTMLRTELELPDGSKAWVPNSSFQDGQVLNHSRLGGWRVCVQVPLDRSTDRLLAQQVMTRVMSELSWNCDSKPAFIAFDHVGSEAMFFNAYAWIADRTEEPWYRGLLLSELVDALEDAGVSVGQTTNLSLGASRLDSERAAR
ncbi:MAG: mechanosensitive ion channel family protein [Ilumatobacter sp.]